MRHLLLQLLLLAVVIVVTALNDIWEKTANSHSKFAKHRLLAVRNPPFQRQEAQNNRRCSFVLSLLASQLWSSCIDALCPSDTHTMQKKRLKQQHQVQFETGSRKVPLLKERCHRTCTAAA
jgi:hypothetical protein